MSGEDRRERLLDDLAAAIRKGAESEHSRPSYRTAEAVMPLFEKMADELEARKEDVLKAAEYVSNRIGMHQTLPASTALALVMTMDMFLVVETAQGGLSRTELARRIANELCDLELTTQQFWGVSTRMLTVMNEMARERAAHDSMQLEKINALLRDQEITDQGEEGVKKLIQLLETERS